MYDRVQARYPGSSWLSEFLGCEDGLFVVRAVLSLEGEPLATALAAAATVEAAEEQARDRLAALLGLTRAPALPQRRPLLPDAAGGELEEPPAAIAPEQPEPAAIADVDDFIRLNAETQRHLKRLGWTGDRLRQHLQHTYGRTSRQQLRDEELLDFLQYLKAQA